MTPMPAIISHISNIIIVGIVIIVVAVLLCLSLPSPPPSFSKPNRSRQSPVLKFFLAAAAKSLLIG